MWMIQVRDGDFSQKNICGISMEEDSGASIIIEAFHLFTRKKFALEHMRRLHLRHSQYEAVKVEVSR